MSSTALWYTTRATAIVALLLLTGTMCLGLLTASRRSTTAWPGFALQDLHKRVSIISLVFLGLHVLTSVADTYVNIGWAALIVPFSSHYKSFWVTLGTIGVDLMIAVAISSLLRPRISPRVWRAIHWLAYGSWPVALAHAFGMGTDMGTSWAVGLGVACIAAVAIASGTRLSLHLDQRRTAVERSLSPTVRSHLSSRFAAKSGA